jgi:hypothetical protein
MQMLGPLEGPSHDMFYAKIHSIYVKTICICLSGLTYARNQDRHDQLIQEHVLLLSEEALRGPFPLGPCQWTRFISGYSAAAVSHQLPIAITLAITSGNTKVAACLPLVYTCSPIRTVVITISSTCPCAFHECHRRRRIVSLWRLYRQIQVYKQ